ncbi:MAG: UDP-N-acetylmuramoyl-tripeptide--D-alanyl-D-alanine ligase [Spirochaetia bacterium]|nr:UDP-N-acetylmuramoyl-tripeptide--D-alanyl-D-alanine ligase [Spirochaetia bacterium]
MQNLNINIVDLLDDKTTLHKLPQESVIKSLCVDSRKLQKGDWFICLKGETFNGHDFIESVLASGAAGIIYDQEDVNVPGLKVTDTTKFLGKLATHWRNIINPVVIAITGSNGKTSVKELISFLLEKYATGKVCQSAGNFNNQFGVPYTLLSLKPEHRFLVVEVGTNHPGEIAPLSILALPDYAVITSVSPGHIGNFGSLESIVEEKSDIITGMKSSGVFITNFELSKNLQILKKINDHKILIKSPDKTLTLLHHNETGINFLFDGETYHYPVCGLHQFQNLLLAYTVLSEIIKEKEQIKKALKELVNYRAVKGRLQKTDAIMYNVWDDTYNANPASYKEAIDFISQISKNSESNAFGAFGMMGELGNFSEKAHEELGKLTVDYGFSAVFFSSNEEKIRNAFLRGRQEIKQASLTSEKPETLVAANTDQDILYGNKYLLSKMKNGDHLLVKGSRSTHMERILKLF